MRKLYAEIVEGKHAVERLDKDLNLLGKNVRVPPVVLLTKRMVLTNQYITDDDKDQAEVIRGVGALNGLSSQLRSHVSHEVYSRCKHTCQKRAALEAKP